MKSILFISFFTLFSLLGTAQGWEELNEEVKALSAKKEYEKAIPVGEKAFIEAQKEYGNEHPSYVITLNNLAGLYKDIGQFPRAEILYLQIKDILKKIFGEHHPYFATILNNLAVLYQAMGEYEKAEPLYVQAKEIRKKTLGEEHPDYVTSINSLADLYETMMQYAKAESLYVQAKEIRKKQ